MKTLLAKVALLGIILTMIGTSFMYFNNKERDTQQKEIIPIVPSRMKAVQMRQVVLGRAKFAGMEYIFFANENHYQSAIGVINITKDSLQVQLLKQQLSHEP